LLCSLLNLISVYAFFFVFFLFLRCYCVILRVCLPLSVNQKLSYSLYAQICSTVKIVVILVVQTSVQETRKDINAECRQKRAIKLVITLRKLPYKKHLIFLNLRTLKYRMLRDDMIKVFKIVNGIYDGKVASTLHYNNISITRGNKFKLHNQAFAHDFRKHFV